MLYAGIDGGQSSTVAVIGDETRVLGRGSGPPADLVGEPRDSTRQRAAIDAALDAAFLAATLDPATRLEALVAGISGFDAGHARAPDLSSRANAAGFVHDTAIAHAGALGGAPGIVVVAGTGSVALGNDAASVAYVRAGGWGYFFGDEGSAIWIARTALRRAMLREDTAEPSELRNRACTFFGATSLRQIQHAFAHGDLSRPNVASFARETLDLADGGEADAVAVRGEAVEALARLCATVDARLEAGPRRISFAGSLFANAGFQHEFGHAVATAVAGAVLVPPLGDAAIGALGLARNVGTA